MKKLKEIVPKMSENSEARVYYTNHSLCVTTMTRMFSSGVPEKIIADKSGA